MKIYKIFHDGKLEATEKTIGDAYIKLQKLSPHSAEHSMRHEGWAIRETIDGKTVATWDYRGQRTEVVGG